MNTDETIIDSHQHFWNIDRFVYKWMPPGPNILRRNYLPENLLPELERCNISRTILVEAHNSIEETRFLLEIAAANDFIAGVVGWVDLTDPHVGKILDDFCRHPKFVGVRHQVESDPDEAWLNRDKVISGLKKLAERDIAYDLVLFPRHLKYIPPLADKVPNLRMVVDHIGKPPIAEGRLEPWAKEIAAVAEIPTVYCKLSGVITEANHSNWNIENLRPYTSHIINIFGMDRLMWGSDWPVCLKAASYEDTLRSSLELIPTLSKETRTAFLSSNAIKFYRLKNIEGLKHF